MTRAAYRLTNVVPKDNITVVLDDNIRRTESARAFENDTSPASDKASFSVRRVPPYMRDEEEIREQYEFLKEHLEHEEMNHEGVRQMFTYYRRALGWVLEEEHI